MYNNILVTGGTSMVGKHLKTYLPSAHYLSSKECDLRDQHAVDKLFKKNRYDSIIHLAAKVGGIMDNINKLIEIFTCNNSFDKIHHLFDNIGLGDQNI